MRDFSKAKRVVVKIGTNTLTKNGGIDAAYVRQVGNHSRKISKINQKTRDSRLQTQDWGISNGEFRIGR